MASVTAQTQSTTTVKSPEHLKGKISQVKHLLDDASKRLQDEASKYTASFKSATQLGNGNLMTKQQQSNSNRSPTNSNDRDVPNDLIRTISDINTLKSVLSCPIFDRIVNVTDSLDRLSYHLNLHPSIGPSDINFDPNGELILAPPIESMAPNEFMNNRINGLNGHSTFADQPQLLNTTTDIHAQSSSTNGEQMLNANIAQPQQQQQHTSTTTAKHTTTTTLNGSSSGPVESNFRQSMTGAYKREGQARTNEVGDDGYMTPSPTNREVAYGTEKLVSNGNTRHYINNGHENSKDRAVPDGVFVDRGKQVGVDSHEGARLYKSNGHFALNEVSHNNTDLVGADYEVADGKVTDTVMSQMETDIENEVTGYSNEMYNSAHGQLFSTNDVPTTMEHQKIPNEDFQESYEVENKEISFTQPISNQYSSELNEAKSQNAPEPRCQRSSCSPSTSGDSTVRMADECDSGASSYQSQALRNAQNTAVAYPDEGVKSTATVYQTQQQHQPTQSREQQKSLPLKSTTVVDDECLAEEHSESIDQNLIEKFSPEMERIKVTLEKDSNGLGITIAGYTCEKEEISGIFIKSITPNSPAYNSGKIRTLDQIFAVNGRELLGYSNPEAVNVLRNTGKKVTLELMRYLAESKYKKLQTALAHAVPSISAKGGKSDGTTKSFDIGRNVSDENANSSMTMGETNSSYQDANRFSMNSDGQVAPHPSNEANFQESLYKNTEMPTRSSESSLNYSADESANVLSSTLSRSTQGEMKFVSRSVTGATKVIETKQGARNTIDIRPPTCQASNATYVNRSLDMDFKPAHAEIGGLSTSITSRMQHDEADDFGSPIRPEWEEKIQIVELLKDPSQGLGFTVKEYVNPKDQRESIIMIRSITPGGVAERDGRLSAGDLLIFVDDISLRGASLSEAVRTLKRVDRQVSLGVLKLKGQ